MATVLLAVWAPEPAGLEWLALEGGVVRRRLDDQGRYAAGDPFDVLVTLHADEPEHLVLESVGTRVWAWVVEERRPMIGTDPCPVTMVALMRRHADLGHDEFAAHWVEEHAALAVVHHAGMHDYAQHVVRRALTPGAGEVDGVALLGFRSRESFETEFYDSDEGRRVIAEDVRRFMAGPGPDTTLVGPPTP